MKVLVACEYSGVVRDAFLRRGHDAVSCDLLPSESSLGFHYTGNVAEIIGMEWDLMIAHPPCTHLSSSGARWFKDKVDEQADAIDFVQFLANAHIPRIAIENPVGVLSTVLRKPDQIVHPYMFGDPFEKRTCLWLKNLPKLTPTNIVEPPTRQQLKSGKSLPEWYSNAPKKDRGLIRSRTFPGFAEAMADQWG